MTYRDPTIKKTPKPKRERLYKLRPISRKRINCGNCPDREKLPDGPGRQEWHMEKCGYYGDRLIDHSGHRRRCDECLAERRLENMGENECSRFDAMQPSTSEGGK